MKRVIIALMSLSFIFINAKGVQALILPKLTMEEMVLRADTIVVGRGERCHIHPDYEGNVLYAFVSFKVDEYLKNNLGEDKIVIMQIAQEKGPEGKFEAGPVALRMDEEVILFLTEEDSQGFRHIFGLSQGKYSVVHDRRGAKQLIQDLKDVQFFDRETGKISDSGKIQVKLTYDEFKELVRQIAKTIEAKKETFAVFRPNSAL